jgi:hypothetical protein
MKYGTRSLSLVACLLGLLSQTAEGRAQLALGLKGGVTYSTIESGVLNVQGSKISIAAGMFVSFPLFGIRMQPEWLFVNKGADLEAGTGEDRKLKLEYNELHLLARLETSRGRILPYLMAGPTISFEYDCDVEVDVEGAEENFECDEESVPVITNRKSRDIGLTAVVGAQTRVGPGFVLLEIRGTLGLTNVSKQESIFFEGELRNRYAALLAGYSIRVRV